MELIFFRLSEEFPTCYDVRWIVGVVVCGVTPSFEDMLSCQNQALLCLLKWRECAFLIWEYVVLQHDSANEFLGNTMKFP